MEELNLLSKKTGMTISKAWMLMISAVLMLLLSSGIIGVMAGINKKDPNDIIESGIFWVMLLIFSICSLWGLFINKKQLPFFNKPSWSIILCCIFIALAYTYISPIIVDIFPFDEKETQNIERIGVNAIIGLLLSLLFTTLQIGIIGHGLLQNYRFKQVVFTVAAVSIVMIVPQAVIGLVFQTLILFYVYYRTSSFQLPLLMTAILIIVEDIFKAYFGNGVTSQNYIRIHLVQHTLLYYSGLVACIAVIIGGLFYVRNHTKSIEWEQPQNDESITFL